MVRSLYSAEGLCMSFTASSAHSYDCATSCIQAVPHSIKSLLSQYSVMCSGGGADWGPLMNTWILEWWQPIAKHFSIPAPALLGDPEGTPG